MEFFRQVEGEERKMYENFILQQFENGKLEGYSWNVDDPEKVICIVHGIGEYGGRFDRVAEAFREKNMAVLAFDLRGHGKSLGKRGHCAPRKDVLSDVSTLIEYAQAIYPEKKLILYGHSMGGNTRKTRHNKPPVRYRSISKLYDSACRL